MLCKAVGVMFCNTWPVKIEPWFPFLDLFEVFVIVHMECSTIMFTGISYHAGGVTSFVSIDKSDSLSWTYRQLTACSLSPVFLRNTCSSDVLRCFCVLQILITRCTVTQRMSSPCHHCTCQTEGIVNDGPIPTVWLHCS